MRERVNLAGIAYKHNFSALWLPFHGFHLRFSRALHVGGEGFEFNQIGQLRAPFTQSENESRTFMWKSNSNIFLHQTEAKRDKKKVMQQLDF